MRRWDREGRRWGVGGEGSIAGSVLGLLNGRGEDLNGRLCVPQSARERCYLGLDRLRRGGCVGTVVGWKTRLGESSVLLVGGGFGGRRRHNVGRGVDRLEEGEEMR
jgi:hypothetical protein